MTNRFKGIKESPLVYLFSKIWKYSEGNRNNIVLYWVMFVLAESIDVFAMPLLWAKVIDVITLQGINAVSINTLQILLLVVLIRVFVVWALHGPARVLELTNAFKAKINYRRFLTKGLLTLPLEWHVDHHSGDTIDKCEKGTTGLNDFSSDSFEFIYCFVRLLGCYGMLVYFSHSASYIVLIMMVISAWVTVRFDKVLLEQYKELNKKENQISASIFDAVSNISTVIILRVEKLVFNAIMHKVEEPLDLAIRTNKTNEFKWFIVSVCCAIMKVLVLGVFFWQKIGTGPGVLVGSVYILISYLNQIGDLFFNFAGMYGYVVRRKTRVMNSEEVAEAFLSENFTNHVLPKDWRCLEVEDLNFSYHNHENACLHLENVSFSMKRGEKIAFVGETGSGKTTFLKICRDLYHPKSLKLTVDGKEIEHGFEGISRAIALVPQDPEIFATTILGNITIGAEYELDFVKKFTNMACFTDVAESLPKKFDSSIKEKGVNLSGGQQQRLALSRGLLACYDKDIILLDEPTSSLDVVTEINVYQNLFREFTDKTIISTIHQIHLLPLFDRICVFDKGRIVASGKIEDLLSCCSQFASLWEAMKKAAEGKFSETVNS